MTAPAPHPTRTGYRYDLVVSCTRCGWQGYATVTSWEGEELQQLFRHLCATVPGAAVPE